MSEKALGSFTQDDIKNKRQESLLGGGQEKINLQHSKGKLTARERIEVLLDDESFEEFGMFCEHKCTNFGMQSKKYLGDGVITGHGTINGRPVFVYSQDFTVLGGSLGAAHGKKISDLIDKAIALGVPIIGLNDSGGARIQEGIDSLGSYGDIFKRNVQASGLIPQISVIMGPCAGGAVYSPALTDFIFMVHGTAHMFLTGPAVVKKVLGEDLTFNQLGGSSLHSKNGVVDLVLPNDIEALLSVRKLLNFLPLSNSKKPPIRVTQDPADRIDMYLNNLIPKDPMQSYNMKDLIRTIADENEFFELQPSFAKNIIIGFGYMDGNSVGFVANQPQEIAGCLDIDSSRKAARFVRFCDAFNIPIVSLVDVPGFLPGLQQEKDAIIKHGAKLLYAYAEATVPKITVITRKAYGGAYIVMGSKHLDCDVNYAWDTAEIAVLGAEQAIEILYSKLKDDEPARKKKIEEYQKCVLSPLVAASSGYIDDIISPSHTRLKICKSLNYLKSKKVSLPAKKHDNLPL
jgi:propionyl-CoA carboxylase beta chain